MFNVIKSKVSKILDKEGSKNSSESTRSTSSEDVPRANETSNNDYELVKNFFKKETLDQLFSTIGNHKYQTISTILMMTPTFKSVHITFEGVALVLKLDYKHELNYTNEGPDCVVNFNERKMIREGCDSVETALNDLEILMKIPELELDEFYVAFQHNMDKELCAKFFTTISRISQTSKSCTMMNLHRNDIAPFLSNFKPEKLEEILLYLNPSEVYELTETVELEQWKKAKKLEAIFGFFSIPIKRLSHFKQIKIRLSSFSKEDAIAIRDTVMQDHLESAQFLIPLCDPEEIRGIFELKKDINKSFLVTFEPTSIEIECGTPCFY